MRQGNPVLLFVEPAADFEQQAAKRLGDFQGLKLQSFLEDQFEAKRSEFDFVMPKFGEMMSD